MWGQQTREGRCSWSRSAWTRDLAPPFLAACGLWGVHGLPGEGRLWGLLHLPPAAAPWCGLGAVLQVWAKTVPPHCGKGESGRWGGPKADPCSWPPALAPRFTPPAPTEPRVWRVPGLSDPRGLWPLSSLPSPSPSRAPASVEVRPAALPPGKSEWRVQVGAGAELTLLLKLLLLPSFQLALPTSCLLFSPTSHSPLWLHLPARLPAPCSPPPTPPSAMSTTPSPRCGSPCCECPSPHSACLSPSHAFCTPEARAVLCVCLCHQAWTCILPFSQGKHGRRRGGCDSKVVPRRRPPRAQSPPPPPPPQPPESPELVRPWWAGGRHNRNLTNYLPWPHPICLCSTPEPRPPRHLLNSSITV